MDQKIFGKNIQKHRNRKQISQRELAEEIDITVQSLSRIERGASFPSFSNLVKIVEILEVTPNQLFLNEDISKELNEDICSDIEEHDALWSSMHNGSYLSADKEGGLFKDEVDKLERLFVNLASGKEFNSRFTDGTENQEHRKFLERLSIFTLGEAMHFNSLRLGAEKKVNSSLSKRVIKLSDCE